MMDFALRGGFDPLMMACERNDYEYVRQLIPHSKLNHKNEKGETCLSVAVKMGFDEISKELIASKADVNVQNKAGQSLVYIASWYNRLEILRLLIQAGSDVNVPDNRQWTPLMIAAYSGYLSIVLELLKNGADSEKKDCFGKKAIDRAKDSRVLEALKDITYEKSIRTPKSRIQSIQHSLSVTRIIADKKRGQAVTQKKLHRSASVENTPIPDLDVAQRRDLRNLVDERIKIIANAYEFHVFQDWSLLMNTSLESELQKAQHVVLNQQENSVKKTSKGLLNKLQAQMSQLIDRSVKRLHNENKETKNSLEDLVSTDEIQEFYRYKFNSVSQEVNESVTETIINKLKRDMESLQNDLFHKISDDISYEFSKLFKLKFT